MSKRSLKLLLALAFVLVVGWLFDILPPKVAKKVSRFCDRASEKVWNLYADLYRRITTYEPPDEYKHPKRPRRRAKPRLDKRDSA